MGFTKHTFSIDLQNVIKKVLVRIIVALSSTDEVTSIYARNVASPGGFVQEVDVYFTLEMRLAGVVARSSDRRLREDDGYDGSAANLTSSFVSDLNSAASSGNLTAALVSAAGNITGVNISASPNATASSTVSTSTIVVEYTRPPTPQPTSTPTGLPTLKPSSLPTSLPTHSPTLSPSRVPTLLPSSQPSPVPSAIDNVLFRKLRPDNRIGPGSAGG